MVRNFAVSQYPLFLIISQSRGTDKVTATITRDTNCAEVIPTLELLHQDFCKQQLDDIPFESEWEERENLKESARRGLQTSCRQVKSRKKVPGRGNEASRGREETALRGGTKA